MPSLPLIAAWQRATHRLLAELERELSGLGLSAGEINALACFGEADARTVGELVDATGQRPSTLTGVLDRLQGRGLVERRPNPRDRRSLLVVLTPEGEQAAGRVQAAFDALEHRVAGELEGTDAGAAWAAVEAVAAAAGDQEG